LLVLGFRSSTALGAAYGIAVTGTMAITTVLFAVLARRLWRWSLWRTAAVAGVFLVVDLAFATANLAKIRQGGWVPLAIAAGLFLLMTTWNRGTSLLNRWLSRATMPLETFLADLQHLKPPRVPGTAVFLTTHIDGAPPVLQPHLRHNKALQEEVILLAITIGEVPEVAERKRVTIEALPLGLYRVRARYGFLEGADVKDILARCRAAGIRAENDDTTYYLGRTRLLPTGPAPMMRWRKRLFGLMARNASSAADFFRIPPDRVVELGARVEFRAGRRSSRCTRRWRAGSPP
jgi:KUP system potassium uptake protein